MAEIKDRQLRQWLCMMYADDNQSHKQFVEDLRTGITKYAYIHHLGNDDHKPHEHVILWFDKPFRLSTLISRFHLDYSSDAHLFKSLDDFKKHDGSRIFSTIDNYIDYLTHQNNPDKPDKYTFDDFVTNCPDRIQKALLGKIPEYESFFNLLDFMDRSKDRDPSVRFMDMKGWYFYCYKYGYGKEFYKNWSKINNLIK